jgi:hypothetical protein
MLARVITKPEVYSGLAISLPSSANASFEFRSEQHRLPGPGGFDGSACRLGDAPPLSSEGAGTRVPVVLAPAQPDSALGRGGAPLPRRGTRLRSWTAGCQVRARGYLDLRGTAPDGDALRPGRADQAPHLRGWVCTLPVFALPWPRPGQLYKLYKLYLLPRV